MKILAGISNAICGGIFVLILGLSLYGIFGTMLNITYDRDNYGLLSIYLILSVFFIFLFVVCAVTLFRGTTVFSLSGGRLFLLNFLGLLILISISLIGFWSDYPSDRELAYLLIPACILFLNLFALRKI